MVDKSIDPLRTHFKPFFASGQSRQTISSGSEVQLGFFRLSIAQPLHDMILQLPLVFWLSSENRRQGAGEHLASRPSSDGFPGCHRWSALPIALRQTPATSFARLQERYPQRLVGAHKMILRTPPLEMSQQVWRLLSRRPGATSQRGYSMADGQWSPLDKSGVQPP